MIKIEKFIEEVIVELPIKTLKFDRDVFDKISDNIYFLTRKSSISKEIIRQKGNIEELNMGHWMCLSTRYQSNFNDPKLKSLDVEFLIKEHII
jgi:hypothetical protein